MSTLRQPFARRACCRRASTTYSGLVHRSGSTRNCGRPHAACRGRTGRQRGADTAPTPSLCRKCLSATRGRGEEVFLEERDAPEDGVDARTHRVLARHWRERAFQDGQVEVIDRVVQGARLGRMSRCRAVSLDALRTNDRGSCQASPCLCAHTREPVSALRETVDDVGLFLGERVPRPSL